MSKKTMGEIIIEAKQKGTLDRLTILSEPYVWLLDPNFERLYKAVNILAKDKGFRVVNFEFREKFIVVLMEKKQ